MASLATWQPPLQEMGRDQTVRGISEPHERLGEAPDRSTVCHKPFTELTDGSGCLGVTTLI